MNNHFIISLVPGTTRIERLTGSTKVKLFIASLFLIMASFDFRIIFPMLVIQIVLLCSIKPNFHRLRYIIIFILITNCINIFLFYLVSPLIGSSLVGQTTVLYQFNSYFVVTAETLFYFFIRLLKITAVLIASMWFVLSITPSQMAAGLYSLKVPYKLCTIVSLGLRYIPDILRDYQNIKVSIQMRGLELDPKKTSIRTRFVQSSLILFPLVVVAFEKVGVIANAMDLRGYGQGKKRSYYSELDPTPFDSWFTGLAIMMISIFVVYTVSGFFIQRPQLWYPF